MKIEMKKALSLIMILTLIVVSAACSNTSTTTTTTSGSSTTATTKKTETSTTQKEELPELKILTAYSAIDMNTYPNYQDVVDLTGYTVKYDNLPAEDAISKVNMVLATGGGYDIIYVPAPSSNYFKYAKEGAIQDLTDLIDTYGQNYITAMDGYKFIDPLRIDGKVFCLPQPNPGAYLASGNFIRKDWLDSIGMAIPQTTDDILDVLRAFKAENPGNVDPCIPYVQGNNLFPEMFAGAFGVATEYVIEDGQLISRYRSESMKDYLSYMNTLFTEKLLDNEFPINTSEVTNNKIFSGKAGLFSYSVWGISGMVNAFKENLPDAEYVLIGYPKGPDGQQGVAVAQGYYGFNVVPKSSPNAEHVVKYANALYQEDNFVKIYDGHENVHWKYDDNGNMTPIQPAFGDERSIASYILGIGETWQLKYWTIRLQKDANLYEWFYKMQDYADMRVFNAPDLAPGFDSVLSSKDELTELATENITKFISGSLSIADYQSFLDAYMAAGGEQAEKDLAEWYAQNK